MLVLRRVLVIATLVLVMASTVQAQIAHGYSNVFALDTVTAVDDGSDLPPAAALQSIYPNPFNPRTAVRFYATQAGPVAVDVFDVRGALVRSLHDQADGAGWMKLAWDGRNAQGASVPSGSYLMRVEAGGRVETVRGVLVE